jgi:hypothetical protein
MKPSGRGMGVAALALATAACAFNPPPVPLDGRAAGLERLVGRWTGDYQGYGSGRAGRIEFTLAAGEGHAHGDVLMIPRTRRRPYRPWRETFAAPALALSEDLTIRFVAIENGEVTGELDPYRDPDCGCRAHTRFRGRLWGSVIEGTFVTTRQGHSEAQGGRWKVRRRDRSWRPR